MTKILTISGRAFDPWAMTADDLDIMDIAHALSMQCRFAGHVPSFYSVAEHCVRAVELRGEIGGFSKEDYRGDLTARSILLHDAEEAYFQDIVSPTKNRPEMKPYVDASVRAQQIISNKFKCLYPGSPGYVEGVEKYDHLAYEWERLNIRTGMVRGMAPDEARAAFLGMWYLVRPYSFG